MNTQIKEILEKQMQLLSERSQETGFGNVEKLCQLTNAMCEVAKVIQSAPNLRREN